MVTTFYVFFSFSNLCLLTHVNNHHNKVRRTESHKPPIATITPTCRNTHSVCNSSPFTAYPVHALQAAQDIQHLQVPPRGGSRRASIASNTSSNTLGPGGYQRPTPRLSATSENSVVSDLSIVSRSGPAGRFRTESVVSEFDGFENDGVNERENEEENESEVKNEIQGLRTQIDRLTVLMQQTIIDQHKLTSPVKPLPF